MSASVRGFTGTRPCSSVSVLVTAGTARPTKPQIFTVWLLTKEERKVRALNLKQTVLSSRNEPPTAQMQTGAQDKRCLFHERRESSRSSPTSGLLSSQKRTIQVGVAQTDACRISYKEPCTPFPLLQRLLPPLAAQRQSHPPPAAAGTTPRAQRRHQPRNASSVEAPPASSRPTGRHAATRTASGPGGRAANGRQGTRKPPGTLHPLKG